MKGIAVEFDWIVRLFIIVSLIFITAQLNQAYLQNTEITTDYTSKELKTQSAALHVLTSGEKFAVNKNLKEQVNDDCTADIPGFREEDPYILQVKGDEECDLMFFSEGKWFGYTPQKTQITDPLSLPNSYFKVAYKNVD